MNNTLKPRNLKKLSLYVRSKGEAIRWCVHGNYQHQENLEPNLFRFDFDHNINSISKIGVEVIERTDTESAVIVELVELGGEALRDLDHFCVYRLKRGGIKRTYGYLDEPGVCMFKIRYNSVAHNFVLYSMPEVRYDS